MSEYKIEYSYYTLYDFEIAKDTLNSFLVFNNVQSKFIVEKKEFDPNTIDFDENNRMIGELLSFNDEVYKDYDQNSMYSYSDILYQKKSILKQDLDEIEINFTDKTKTKKILGYECYFAEINYKSRVFEVYYNDSFGENKGPWKLHGLPGIILEVREKMGLIHIKAKKISKTKEKIHSELSLYKSNSWDEIITKASILYSKNRQKLIRCCSQNPQIDTSGNIENYSLNPDLSYKINYKVSIILNENNKLESSLVSDFELITSSYQSQYKYIEKIQNHQGLAEYGFISETGVLYKNLTDSIMIQDKKIASEKYVIEDKIPTLNWIMLKETKEHLGFNLNKAMANYNGLYIIVWYTKEIPINNGPEKFYGLPGLILEVEVKNNIDEKKNETTYYTASEVVKMDNSDIVKPKKGKNILLIEFENKQKEYYEKMMEMYGGGIETEE